MTMSVLFLVVRYQSVALQMLLDQTHGSLHPDLLNQIIIAAIFDTIELS